MPPFCGSPCFISFIRNEYEQLIVDSAYDCHQAEWRPKITWASSYIKKVLKLVNIYKAKVLPF